MLIYIAIKRNDSNIILEAKPVTPTTYKIEVKRNDCISCGVCYNTDPTHFEADYENKSAVVEGKGYAISKGSFEDGLIDDAKTAMKSCPVSAITIIESPLIEMKN